MAGFKIFREFNQEEKFIGGKAYVLSQLIQQDLPVPDGAVLWEKPSAEDWPRIESWWKSIGQPELAVRSSALGEDSAEFSYAGQQKTFLNVATFEQLREAVDKCFASTESAASRAYRQHFSQAAKISMNVILQEMVAAKLAGVFFSRDPRPQQSGWLIECVEGLGEKLVSGQVTPDRIKENSEPPTGWQAEWTDRCVQVGKACEEFLQAPVDMEWAVGQDDQFYLLQARPITAVGQAAQDAIQSELLRLQKSHEAQTVWDGHTFAEWTGAPSELTFSLWQKAFAAEGAFSKALQKLGYLAEMQSGDEPLLERVFGRAYINLQRLSPLFFGPVPYRIDPQPRPHLVFDFSKLTFKMVLNTPRPLWRMLSVGWNLKTHRQENIDQCREQWRNFEALTNWPARPEIYKSHDGEELDKLFLQEVKKIVQEVLLWPFVLTVLIESTLQSLQMMLEKIDGEEGAKDRLQTWLSAGVHTVTEEMGEELSAMRAENAELKVFIEKYGHRGPGEMDLSQPRWAEWPAEKLRQKDGGAGKTRPLADIEKEIAGFGVFRAPVILQEWLLLKQMLELRERWKMSAMRPYAHLRWLAMELAARRGLEEDVFWLRPEELSSDTPSEELKTLAKTRRQEVEALRKVSLPAVVDLQTVGRWLDGKVEEKSMIQAEGLSMGVSSGTVVHVEDVNLVDLDSLPEDFVLVARATDPGWTPLFRKAKAIVVEHGGILSHCAIVAREMGVPAVSGVDHIFQRLPQGRKAWIDGTHGRISLI